jgi:hypothetical protein
VCIEAWILTRKKSRVRASVRARVIVRASIRASLCASVKVRVWVWAAVLLQRLLVEQYVILSGKARIRVSVRDMVSLYS